MLWVRIFCFAGALAWTALMFLAYSDLGLAFRASLIGWLICAAGWVARLTLARLVKTAQLSKKLKMLHPRYLAIAGAVAGVRRAVQLLPGAGGSHRRRPLGRFRRPATSAAPHRDPAQGLGSRRGARRRLAMTDGGR